MSQTPESILQTARLFTQVDPDNHQKLLDIAQLREFEAGEIVFRQGDPCPGLFIVGQGQFRVFKLAPNGKEHVLHLVGPGGTFAEVAVVGGFPCPAFAEAIEPSICVMLPAAAFVTALRQSHDLCFQLLTGMASWVHSLTNMIEDIALRDAVGRVARYLVDNPSDSDGHLQLPVLKRHLANHLNLTSETFSRTLRRLAEANLIETNGGTTTLRILDTEGLRTAGVGGVTNTGRGIFTPSSRGCRSATVRRFRCLRSTRLGRLS